MRISSPFCLYWLNRWSWLGLWSLTPLSTFFSAMSWRSVLLFGETGIPGGNTYLSQVTDKFHHITLYWVHLSWAVFELTHWSCITVSINIKIKFSCYDFYVLLYFFKCCQGYRNGSRFNRFTQLFIIRQWTLVILNFHDSHLKFDLELLWSNCTISQW